MPASRPDPRVRGAFEAMLRLGAPGLDLLLGVGDRVSRVLERRDDGYGIVRMEHDGLAAPRSLRPRPGGRGGYPRRSEAA